MAKLLEHKARLTLKQATAQPDHTMSFHWPASVHLSLFHPHRMDETGPVHPCAAVDHCACPIRHEHVNVVALTDDRSLVALAR